MMSSRRYTSNFVSQSVPLLKISVPSNRVSVCSLSFVNETIISFLTRGNIGRHWFNP